MTIKELYFTDAVAVDARFEITDGIGMKLWSGDWKQMPENFRHREFSWCGLDGFDAPTGDRLSDGAHVVDVIVEVHSLV